MEEIEANKDTIISTLTNFGIQIERIKATIGPTITLYEIVPKAGVRISRIKNLEDDIALSLSALGIRIIAPIPGKGTIGIEVPNKNKELTSLHAAITADIFSHTQAELPVILGKGITGEVKVADLTQMPHVLIAGATGQGKSVGLNVMITSLLYKKNPHTLKIVLVDPKKVELSLFSLIEKQYLAKLARHKKPIVTDTSEVVYVLNSLCKEMEQRLELFEQARCRDIKAYNMRYAKGECKGEQARFFPYIVLVIDELADLMMTAGKEVEMPIARLAQKSRSSGIHLIVATQRPSVNVITGMIKANFPARISFKVVSQVDSRTILDSRGAEKLTGKGDMLFSLGSEMERLQCPYISTEEVEAICGHIQQQASPKEDYFLPEVEEDKDTRAPEADGQRDPLFDEAAKIVIQHGQGSTSHLQRKLEIGFNRAGRLMDQLEAAGIVGPPKGSKPRDVLGNTPPSL